MRTVSHPADFAAWRSAARGLLKSEVPPDEVDWQESDDQSPVLALGEDAAIPNDESAAVFRVPRRFAELAATVACHRDPRRWSLLYRVLWRLTHGEPHVLAVTVDPEVHALEAMARTIRRDTHKMRAFVRFRAVAHPDGGEWFVAWFEPGHHIVERNAQFFRDRFASQRWSILTPDRCVHWNGHHLQFTPGVTGAEAPGEDAVEDLWLRYYSSIFNPARVKVHAMQAEMPRKYWKNLPEAAAIPGLLQAAPERVAEMVARSQPPGAELGPSVEALLSPAPRDLDSMRELAAACRACPLYQRATQTVFGEGPADAALVFVGEQPGDQEDRQGRPFVGPAGLLFNRALADASIDRETIYLTNAVKHFKWEPRGKRRLHEKPNTADIAVCRPWLAAELAILRPRVLVCLGATAARSLLGTGVKVLRDRGAARSSEFCEQTLVTIHPSALLRTPDQATREAGYEVFVNDLRLAARLLDSRQ